MTSGGDLNSYIPFLKFYNATEATLFDKDVQKNRLVNAYQERTALVFGIPFAV